jgi:hypothetical protein
MLREYYVMVGDENNATQHDISRFIEIWHSASLIVQVDEILTELQRAWIATTKEGNGGGGFRLDPKIVA